MDRDVGIKDVGVEDDDERGRGIEGQEERFLWQGVRRNYAQPGSC
jgi:hypothetical protein